MTACCSCHSASCFMTFWLGHALKSKFCTRRWPFKEASSRQAIFTMEKPGVVTGNFALRFSLNFWSIFGHISGSIRPITLIWASLERCFPPAEVAYRLICQFWSEVKERRRFITAGYGRHSSQWVNRQLITCTRTIGGQNLLHACIKFSRNNIFF